MEPVELSVEEQIELFHSLAAQRGMLETKLWHKGLSLCLEQDKENKVTPEKPSQVRRYLRETIRSDTSKVIGLNVEFIALGINQAKQQGILNDADATKMYADIIFSGALIDKEEQRILLSKPEVRAELHERLDEIHLRSGSQDRDSKEGRVAYLLEMYERCAIMEKTNEGLEIDQKLRKVLGKKMAKAVRSGIAPSKTVTSKLLHDDQITKDTLMQARMIAEATNKDRLAERQENMEKAGFVRKIINRKRQNDD